jgi:hypothetical protein
MLRYYAKAVLSLQISHEIEGSTVINVTSCRCSSVSARKVFLIGAIKYCSNWFSLAFEYKMIMKFQFTLRVYLDIQVITNCRVYHLGRRRRRWEDYTRIYLKEIDLSTRNCIDSAQDRNYWGAFSKMELNLRVPQAIEPVIILSLKVRGITLSTEC